MAIRPLRNSSPNFSRAKKPIDRSGMVGARYGKLVVLQILPKNRLKVKCDCGVLDTKDVHNVKNGTTQSCGCKRLEEIPSGITAEQSQFIEIAKTEIELTGEYYQAITPKDMFLANTLEAQGYLELVDGCDDTYKLTSKADDLKS